MKMKGMHCELLRERERERKAVQVGTTGTVL